MSEKIKGMFGSETRADEVKEWLKNQGAVNFGGIYDASSEKCIYYVEQGNVRVINERHSVLFDIVELPRWRAERGAKYYFVDYTGVIGFNVDVRATVDNAVYEIGNYFQTREEAKKYAEKIREIFKERRGNE